MSSLAERYAHVPARTVRFWALIDSSVSWPLALPVMAPHFVAMLYWLNGLLGGASDPPVFEAMHLLFVCLTGCLVSVWVVARLLHPIGLMALIDGWGRTAVALVLVWLLLGYAAPPVLWLFVFTEGIGALAQLRAAYRPS